MKESVKKRTSWKAGAGPALLPLNRWRVWADRLSRRFHIKALRLPMLQKIFLLLCTGSGRNSRTVLWQLTSHSENRFSNAFFHIHPGESKQRRLLSSFSEKSSAAEQAAAHGSKQFFFSSPRISLQPRFNFVHHRAGQRIMGGLDRPAANKAVFISRFQQTSPVGKAPVLSKRIAEPQKRPASAVPGEKNFYLNLGAAKVFQDFLRSSYFSSRRASRQDHSRVRVFHDSNFPERNILTGRLALLGAEAAKKNLRTHARFSLRQTHLARQAFALPDRLIVHNNPPRSVHVQQQPAKIHASQDQPSSRIPDREKAVWPGDAGSSKSVSYAEKGGGKFSEKLFPSQRIEMTIKRGSRTEAGSIINRQSIVHREKIDALAGRIARPRRRVESRPRQSAMNAATSLRTANQFSVSQLKTPMMAPAHERETIAAPVFRKNAPEKLDERKLEKFFEKKMNQPPFGQAAVPAAPRININELTDSVMQQIDRKMIIWRERTGRV